MQCRSRQPDSPAQLVHCPIRRRGIVHERERPPDEAIAKTREPAKAVLRQRVDIATYRVDEHHLAHALEHGFSARALVCRFRDGLSHELSDPVLAIARAQMHESRECRDQGIEGAQVETQEAA